MIKIDIKNIFNVQNNKQKSKKKKKKNNDNSNDTITTIVTLDTFTSDIGMQQWFDRYFDSAPVTYTFDTIDIKNVQVNETEFLKQMLSHHNFDHDPEILSFILHEIQLNCENAFSNNISCKQVKDIIKNTIKSTKFT